MDNSPFFFLTLTYTLALTKSPTGMSTLEKIGVVIKTSSFASDLGRRPGEV